MDKKREGILNPNHKPMKAASNPKNKEVKIKKIALRKSPSIRKCKQSLIQELKVVRAPQKPTPTSNLALNPNLAPTRNPIIPQPIILVKK